MYIKYTLNNGVRIVYEKIPYVRSVTIGIWVRTGSGDENPNNNGISHFIEHMLFKGTEKRSAAEIAESIDNIGGQLNAFTGKECTCFYAKVLDEHLDTAVEVLGDMFFSSVYAKKDIAVEKKVILEEIGMYEDSPEELVHDLLTEAVWDGSAIGYPILGTRKSLRKINRDTILQYLEERYTTKSTVISIAGNFDEDQLKELLERTFGGWVSRETPDFLPKDVQLKPVVVTREKDTEQVHLCIGYEGVSHGDDRMYPLLVINNIIGGGMSSRLFQKIREKKGLVYSIYSYPTAYSDAGLFTVYAGMKPEQLVPVTAYIYEEIRQLLKKGITEQELSKSKEQLKGNLILGLESTSGRMTSIGKAELLHGTINTPEEILSKIDAIRMHDITAILDSVFASGKKGISVVGGLKKDFEKESLM